MSIMSSKEKNIENYMQINVVKHTHSHKENKKIENLERKTLQENLRRKKTEDYTIQYKNKLQPFVWLGYIERMKDTGITKKIVWVGKKEENKKRMIEIDLRISSGSGHSLKPGNWPFIYYSICPYFFFSINNFGIC